jgi:hypothetical protein
MKQADLFAAQERGKLGAQRAGQRAERLDPNWIELAALYLALYADLAPEPFLVEQASTKYPRRPLDGRAWGQAVRHAARQGWIKRVGYAPSASSNGSPKCLWAKR